MEIPFLGYAMDCIVNGTVVLREQRMSDLLRDRDLVAVRNIEADALEDGRLLRQSALDMSWDEFVLVSGAGPQGDPAQRFYATRKFPVRVVVDPYEIVGYLHAPAGTDAIAFARHRRVIPLTDAAVRVRRASGSTVHRHATLLLHGRHGVGIESVPDVTVRALVAKGTDPLEPEQTRAPAGSLMMRVAAGAV